VDIESFSAYTDVYFEPILKDFDEDNMDVMLMIMKPDSSLIPVEYSDESVWNTSDNAPGRYSVYVIIFDKNTGQIIDIKDKQFYISEGFELLEAYLNITPRYYRLDSNDTAKIVLSLFANTNTPKTLNIGIRVTDEDEKETFPRHPSSLQNISALMSLM
jgi:hypothetical protein